jgi:hypothetical protein
LLVKLVVGPYPGSTRLMLTLKSSSSSASDAVKPSTVGLARGVHRHQRHPSQGRARRHVHDHARSPLAELRQHRLRHRHHAERVDLEHLARRPDRGGLKDAEGADARVVDQHVDGAGGLERSRDRLRLGHVERDQAKPLRLLQDIFARRAHGGDHVPTLRVKWRAVSRP